jgi:hypothetical protein
MSQELENMGARSYVETQEDEPLRRLPDNSILIALKTTLETKARESFISVYATSVPVKQASGTLE